MATAYQWIGQGSRELPLAGHSRVNQARKPQLVPLRRRETSTVARHRNKPAIVEFYTVKRIDNSRLVRRVEPVKLRNLYKTVVLGGIIAACFVLYACQHFRCIDLSFQLEELRSRQEQAQAMNSKLKLDIAYLRDPRRIDIIARHQLGLTQPTANQVREYAAVDGAEVAAVQYVWPNRAP